VLDTYSSIESAYEIVYDDLVSGTHTISITVLADRNPLSSDELVRLDYIDAWDGTEMADGWYEADLTYADNNRVDLSGGWSPKSDSTARGDLYCENGNNVWFRFTGEAVTYLAFTDRNAAASAEILIDGVSQGVVDLTYDFSNAPLPFHFTGLGAGPHVMRVRGVAYAGVDAFEPNPISFHPGVPMVEWYDTAPAGNEGAIATASAGDLDGDGLIEIAVSSDNGNFYLYRGDGADAGSGSPILWQYATGREPDAPALVDLDGNPGAEIVVGSNLGIHAFHADGSLYWFTDTVRATWPTSGAAVGNLDDDDEPEIVVAADRKLAVFEADGRLTWQYALGSAPPSPVLADLTGDGYLDILVVDGAADTATLFDYDRGIAPNIAWTHVFTSDLDSVRGAPAVADIDGLLPGGDSGPEIAIATSGFVYALDADGSVIWASPVGAGEPGGVSIADTDGDGEVEIITTIRYAGGRIYVLNADGSLLWEGPALDESSGTSASVHDLDGDGIWELVWNGHEQGLTIYRGNDGEILFNEPYINSVTWMDYPSIADVDGDGHAEIVAVDKEGVYIVGHDPVWAESRPLWNQYNYHITNINDDWSVPPVEPNSWETHNTYRTQTPLETPAPVYHVELTHTVPLSGLVVLSDTFSAEPDTPAPAYHWAYEQPWYEPVHTTTFDIRLPDMQAGEVRQVSEGTEVAYQLPSGRNRLTLPPLYVAAAHIVALQPASLTTTPGGLAAYQVLLSNPASTAETYTLTLSGLNEGWATLPPTITLQPSSDLTLPLTVTVPVDAALDDHAFTVAAATATGGQDQAHGLLTVADRLRLAITPPWAYAHAGLAVTYTLTVTNLEAVARQYTLSVTGLEGNQVDMPATVDLPASSDRTATLTVTALAPLGIYPFQATAGYTETGVILQAHAGAGLTIFTDLGVDGDLAPPLAIAGQASPAVYTLTVTNTGGVSDTYDVALDLPAGWSSDLSANGHPQAHLSLSPYVFHSAGLRLLVTPADGTPPGDYAISAILTSRSDPSVQATVPGTARVVPQGVTVDLSPQSTAMAPPDTAIWNVTVTNTGQDTDTFDLRASGIVSSTAVFSTDPVTLGAGASTVVQMTGGPLSYALPQTYPLAVTAHSQAEPAVFGFDQAQVTFGGYEDVSVTISPTHITLSETGTVHYLVLITNTGNLDTIYTLSTSSQPAAPSLKLEADELYIPPHMTAALLLTARAARPGTYSLTVQADSTTSTATGSDQATLTVEGAQYDIYLPLLFAGHAVPAQEPPEPTPEPPAPLEADYRLYLPVLVRPGGQFRDARP
jgi:uncharacterized membrane protein